MCVSVCVCLSVSVCVGFLVFLLCVCIYVCLWAMCLIQINTIKYYLLAGRPYEHLQHAADLNLRSKHLDGVARDGVTVAPLQTTCLLTAFRR